MSRVFVVQQPAYYDTARSGWVNKFDLSPARAHGELVFLLRPSNVPKDKLAEMTAHLDKALEDFSEDDFILPIGDPIATAAAVMIAGFQTGGYVKLLKWDRFKGEYDAYVLDLGCNDGSTDEEPATL